MSEGRQPSLARVWELVLQEAKLAKLRRPQIILGKRRTQRVVRARARVALQLLDEGYSMTGIGKRLNIDHTAVCHYKSNRLRWL